MMTLTYILAAVVLLGLCIFIHELGHLLGGKMVGIKARTFSLGYGKGFIKKKIGDTTYQVTLIPFGGYCQFYGEDPSEERSGEGFEFLSAHPLKRMVTVAMGPLFNLFFGILLFFVMNLVGYTQETNRIYIPEQGSSASISSPAYDAGLRTGDEVVNINGKTIRGFTDIQAAVIFSDGGALDFTVKRAGAEQHLQVKPEIRDGSGRYSIGVAPFGDRVLIAGVLEDDVAQKAGMQEMDEVLSVDGETLASPLAFTDYIKGKAGQNVLITVKRKDETVGLTVVPRVNTIVTIAGNKAGDNAAFDTGMLRAAQDKNFIRLNGSIYPVFENLMSDLKKLNGKEIALEVSETTYKGTLSVEERGFIGVFPALSPEMVLVKYSAGEGFVQALIEPYEFIVLNIKGMGMLFSGEMSVRENVSGPIRIAKIAGDVAYYKGAAAFIILMAKISIILMVMNLLPIPAVDGSHLIFYFIELVRGKPLSQVVMERIQTAGVIILIILGAFIIVNDISMLPIVQRLLN
ncbi:MAG TPA: RIP metalloprotease RseP [Spirochaetota bacterium]|nr:RIP metalloprotease RseP [Spirochaetota bacterium]HPI90735.1 RIP metalloprotease RseP [Spirochaetota bacterium]HPR46361.1 RIP metalloprotease RseP [Spirochaetota bacterium]